MFKIFRNPHIVFGIFEELKIFQLFAMLQKHSNESGTPINITLWQFVVLHAWI